MTNNNCILILSEIKSKVSSDIEKEAIDFAVNLIKINSDSKIEDDLK